MAVACETLTQLQSHTQKVQSTHRPQFILKSRKKWKENSPPHDFSSSFISPQLFVGFWVWENEELVE